MDGLSDFGLTIAEVAQVVNGVPEPSVSVEVPEGIASFDYENVLALAKAYGQESVLYVGPDRLTMRDWLDDRYQSLEIIGTWAESLPWEPAPFYYVRELDGSRYYPQKGRREETA